jgi:hypothetical protein
VHGDAEDDFSIDADRMLRVSDRALEAMRAWRLRFCDVASA